LLAAAGAGGCMSDPRAHCGRRQPNLASCLTGTWRALARPGGCDASSRLGLGAPEAGRSEEAAQTALNRPAGTGRQGWCAAYYTGGHLGHPG
jgi:hypothetical protein